MIRKTIFTVFLTVLFACSSSDEETNVAPRVSFITPSENISVVIGDVINIQVNAEDPDGQIDTVYIEFNGENVAQITSIPYEFSFNTAFEIKANYTVLGASPNFALSRQNNGSIEVCGVSFRVGSV